MQNGVVRVRYRNLHCFP